jgi:hypothetical protein
MYVSRFMTWRLWLSLSAVFASTSLLYAWREAKPSSLTAKEMMEIRGRECYCVELPQNDCMTDEECASCAASAQGQQEVDQGHVCADQFKDYAEVVRTLCDTTGTPPNGKMCDPGQLTCWSERDCDSTLVPDKECSTGYRCATSAPAGHWCKECTRGMQTGNQDVRNNDKCVDCNQS